MQNLVIDVLLGRPFLSGYVRLAQLWDTSVGSCLFCRGNLVIRIGAMCYFAGLEGKSWVPVAFGKMSLIESREAIEHGLK